MKLYDNLRSVLIPSGYKSGQIYPQKQLVMNDPAYWFNNGTAGNYISTPNSAANNITGDIEIIVYWANQRLGDYALVAKYSGGGTRSFLFNQGSDGKLSLWINNAAATFTSTVNNPLLNSSGWLKVFRNATTGLVTFWQSTNSLTTPLSSIVWTQIGANINGTIGALSSATTILEIGSWGGGSAWNCTGSIYRATIATSQNGTPVVDFNPMHFNWNASMLQNGQTFTSRTTNEVWTIVSTGQSFIMPNLETIPFTRGSSGTRSLASGIIENLGSNMPRLDSPLYGCPGILMGPQRTNLDPNSATFAGYVLDNSGGVTISNVVAPNPFNYANVVKVIPNAVNGQHRPFANFNFSADGRIYCIAKADGYNFLSMGNSGGVTGGGTIFNLANGTIATNAGSNPVIKNMGNGWYWCEIDATLTNLSRWFIIRNANNTSDYVGDGTSGILFCHKQLEVGSFGSSPIITVGGSATRLADTITAASYHFIGLGNKGTIVIDYTLLGLPSSNPGSSPFSLADNLNISTNKLRLLEETTTGLRVTDVINNVTFYSATQTVGTRYKVLFKWDNTYGCCYVNGVKILEIFNATPYYFNYIRNLSMTASSIRLNGLTTDNVAVSHADCVKLTT